MPDRMALSESKEAQVSGVDNVKVGMVASSAEAVGAVLGVVSLDQSTIVDFSSPEMSSIPSPVCSMVDDPKGILDSAGIQVEEKGGDSRAPQVLDKLPTQIFSDTPNVKNNTVTQASILFPNRGDRNPGLKEKLEKRVPTPVATEESEVKPRCSDKAEGVAVVSEVAAQMIQMISEAAESGAETGGKEFDFEGEGTGCGEDVEAENIGQSAPVAREVVAVGEVEAGDTKGEAESGDSEIDNDASSYSKSGCSVEDEDDEGISDLEQESAKDNVAIHGTCEAPHPTQICSKNKSAPSFPYQAGDWPKEKAFLRPPPVASNAEGPPTGSPGSCPRLATTTSVFIATGSPSLSGIGSEICLSNSEPTETAKPTAETAPDPT
ncbi:hypothetical protein U1Q18_009805 [Sarracenia purpurea var. burkii]